MSSFCSSFFISHIFDFGEQEGVERGEGAVPWKERKGGRKEKNLTVEKQIGKSVLHPQHPQYLTNCQKKVTRVDKNRWAIHWYGKRGQMLTFFFRREGAAPWVWSSQSANRRPRGRGLLWREWWCGIYLGRLGVTVAGWL